MAAKTKAAKAGAAVAAARTNPYVVRVLEDDELRDNLVQAYESARGAYTKLSDGKHPASAVFEDKKLQRDLQKAAVAIREAGTALKDAPKAKKKKRRRGGLGRKLLLVAVAGGLALALSEGLRKKALDALFGAEEEFEYTSPTTATPAPPAPAAAS